MLEVICFEGLEVSHLQETESLLGRKLSWYSDDVCFIELSISDWSTGFSLLPDMFYPQSTYPLVPETKYRPSRWKHYLKSSRGRGGINPASWFHLYSQETHVHTYPTPTQGRIGEALLSLNWGQAWGRALGAKLGLFMRIDKGLVRAEIFQEIPLKIIRQLTWPRKLTMFFNKVL